MEKSFFIIIICLVNLLISPSCTDDLLPEEVSNEIQVGCKFLNYFDATLSKDIYVSAFITNGCVDRTFNFIGHCWNFNTDTLPTILSPTKKVGYANITFNAFRSTDSGKTLSKVEPVTTNIVVAPSDLKITVRSFIIFNDTIVRYSEPVIMENPYDYAN